jgi:FtsP/CotA-like multicopper oxidase with cupredoxin domain
LHRLTVIASDGIDIEHVIVDSIIINPGERYDFILNATEPVDRYRIRGRMLSERGTYGTIIAHSKFPLYPYMLNIVYFLLLESIERGS